MKKRSLWSRVLTILLVVCMLMTDQSTSLFVEAVSAAAQQQTEGEETLQQSSGENNQEIQEGGEETSGNDETQTLETSGTEEQTSEQEISTEDNQSETIDEEVSESLTDGEDTAEKQSPEVPAAAKSAQAESQTAAGSLDLLAANDNYTSVKDMADAYFGTSETEATDPKNISTVAITREDSLGNMVMTGDELHFRIEYSLTAAPTFNYGNQNESIYDSYKNTEIRVKLPKGLTLSAAGAGGIGEPVMTEEEGYNLWTLPLTNTSIPASSGTGASFTVTVAVDGNGTRPIGERIDFADQKMVSIYTTFVVLDKASSPVQEVGTYFQETYNPQPIEDVTLTSNDRWGIEKSFVNFTPSSDKKTVTVRYKLGVGLMNGEDKVISDGGAYAVQGRTPFVEGSVKIMEKLSVNDREGNPITPNSVTVTPDFGEKTSIEVTEGLAFEIPVDTCQGKNISGVTVADSAPYYSTYTVEVVYPYEKFIAKYSDPLDKQQKLTVENTATLTYQLQGQEFSFTLTADANNSEGATLPEETTVTAKKDETKGFGNITFTESGVFTFYIKETNSQRPGYTNDPAIWKITAVVNDIGGELKADISYERDQDGEGADSAFESESPDDNTVTFTNRYQVEPVRYAPIVEKKITGAYTPEDKTFTFTLTADPDNPKDGAELGTGPNGKEVTIEGDGSTSFQEITFTKKGTYHFTIQEKDGGEEGYKYDTNLWTVTVELIDDQTDDNNKLKTRVSYSKNGENVPNADRAEFTNEYSITEFTEAAPNVQKTFDQESQSRPTEKEFTFTLIPDRNNPKDGAVIAQGGESLTIQGAGEESFEKITFKKAGIYRFQIKEEPGQENGYTYDSKQWLWQVTVKNQDSKLYIPDDGILYSLDEVSQNTDKAVFTNTYKPKTVTYTPEVEKRITGETPQEVKEFTFTLEQIFTEDTPQGGAELSDTSATATTEKAGKFGPITFTKAGTYTFLITEDQTSKHNGYDYDENTWTLTVKVKDNNGQLELDGEPVYTPAQEADDVKENTENAVFVNTYSVTPTSQTLSVVKEITGDETPTDKDFYFELSAVNGTPADGYKLPENTEVKITGRGTGTFDAIAFTRAGDYTFQIQERNTQEPGYGYDPDPWTVKIHVEDQDSVLKVTNVVYEKNGKTVEGAAAAAFENTYTVKSTAFTPKAEKLLTGADTPEDKNFYFTMEADKANLKDGAQMGGQEAQVTGSGQTNFAPITFTQAGTYRFFIKETQGSQEEYRGYTFDDTIWTLVVTVEDINGQLTVNEEETMYLRTDEETGEEVSSDMAVFTNDYQVTPADHQLHVTKTVTGDNRPSEETFRFNLTEIQDEDEGAQLPQNTSIEITGNGEAAYEAIHFTKAGTYKFEIREENTGRLG
ncbi:MAG TPA: hypothetical protein H9935_03840 [Candidatus Blautia merdigallinarum]|uniref:Streptococcal pilin isopeptide linkage domain-containing protein n=1 Tax=Candidatus Blautia merdigallinarum TaxID=2838495 RepID=A0A9D2N3G4_9FIRM|nr:hypothetical protein [Candidatus Blautia merdigallinarum]